MAAACLTCAPDQGHARDPEHDDVFEPDDTYLACIDNLRALLDCYGLEAIVFEPPNQEYDELNVERYLATL